jgi:hypothetical protein
MLNTKLIISLAAVIHAGAAAASPSRAWPDNAIDAPAVALAIAAGDVVVSPSCDAGAECAGDCVCVCDCEASACACAPDERIPLADSTTPAPGNDALTATSPRPGLARYRRRGAARFRRRGAAEYRGGAPDLEDLLDRE